jgi:hypothetical protein
MSVAFDSVLTVRATATTPGLVLRPWAEQDIPAMVAAHRDPVLRQWLRHPVATADEARQVPPLLPDFPDDGLLHIRLAGSWAQQ